jgi:cytidylate kinase
LGIITISRQTGSDGEVVAGRVASGLGYSLVDRQLLEKLVLEHGLTWGELDESDEERGGTAGAAVGEVHVDYLQAVLLDLAGKQDMVVLGRGGQLLFRGCPWSLHVRVVAGIEARRAALQRAQDLTDADAEAVLEAADRRRSDWIRQHYGGEWEDPTHYDLIVRTDRTGVEGAAAAVRSAAEVQGIGGHVAEIAAWVEQRETTSPREHPGESPGFMHPSEAELARVLDFYRLRWQYEPKSFPLAWDDAGNVTEAFTPDFYLPDVDLYLELTTLKQSLVTEKNRKIRKFRELYPDIRLKIFYGRDFRSLVRKYGLSATAPGSPPGPTPHHGAGARPS